jgi:hypothetical protein
MSARSSSPGTAKNAVDANLGSSLPVVYGALLSALGLRGSYFKNAVLAEIRLAEASGVHLT